MKPNSKKNILFLTNDFPPTEGGMENCASEIYNELKNYYNIFLIIGRNNSYKEKLNSFEIKFFNNYILKILQIFFLLLKVTFTNKIDLIYINTWSPFGLPVFLISKIFNLKFFITCHGLDIVEPQKSNFYNFLMQGVLKNANKLFCVSNYTKSLVDKVTKCNSIVINNGINLKKFYILDKEICKKTLKSEDKFILLTISRLTPRKGHILILKNIKELSKKIPNIKYIIVGRGSYEKEIKKEIKKLNIEKFVELKGFVEDKDLIYYYNACDLFVMISDEILETGDVEGFGISYLEANACGKFVLAGNKGGVKDAVKHRKNGFIINNENELKEKILILYENPILLKEFSRKAFEFVYENFQWNKIIKKMVEEIEI